MLKVCFKPTPKFPAVIPLISKIPPNPGSDKKHRGEKRPQSQRRGVEKNMEYLKSRTFQYGFLCIFFLNFAPLREIFPVFCLSLRTSHLVPRTSSHLYPRTSLIRLPPPSTNTPQTPHTSSSHHKSFCCIYSPAQSPLQNPAPAS